MKSVNYYNQESQSYSNKRYPKEIRSYLHFFFRKRLNLVKTIIGEVAKKNDNLLEIGCADGVIVLEIYNDFPGVFNKIIGIDNASRMIDEAKTKNYSPEIDFYLRDNWQSSSKFNIILEVGVFNFTNMPEEIGFVKGFLEKDGCYICSVASPKSLKNFFQKEDKDFKNFYTFGEYEKEFAKYFEIKKIIPYGLFFPYLWKIPLLGSFLQPLLELIFAMIIPETFHEKIYLLKNKA